MSLLRPVFASLALTLALSSAQAQSTGLGELAAQRRWPELIEQAGALLSASPARLPGSVGPTYLALAICQSGQLDQQDAILGRWLQAPAQPWPGADRLARYALDLLAGDTSPVTAGPLDKDHGRVYAISTWTTEVIPHRPDPSSRSNSEIEGVIDEAASNPPAWASDWSCHHTSPSTSCSAATATAATRSSVPAGR